MIEKYKLPDGWRWVRLGELFDFQQGAAMSPKRRQGISPHPFLRTSNVFWGRIDLSTLDEMDFTHDEIRKLALKTGDLLICEGGEVGRTAIWRGEIDICLHQNHVHRLRRLNDNVIPEFYMYWMQAAFKVFKLYSGQASETTIPNLSIGRLKSFLVPFPPKETQRRIAAKLRELMQEIERARSACEKQLEAANALPSAYLREVFESEEAKKWERKKLGEVCEFLDSMRIPVNDVERRKRIAGKKQSELYPYYGANGQVGWIDGYLFDEELVLLAEDGGFFGSTERPIAYRVSGKCWVNNHAHVLRPKKDIINADWLYFTLAIRPDVIQFVSGTTRPKLNQEQASLIPIPLPPLPVQHRIATELKEKMAYVEKLKSAIQNQKSALEALPQAILRKAFRGEL